MKEMLRKYMSDFTSLSEKEQKEIVDAVELEKFQKGTYLIKQGDIPSTKCYFTLKGCVRQFYVDESGKESTTNFYTEEQAIVLSNFQEQGQPSPYTLICLEDCILVVGDFDHEIEMFEKYAQLETMTRKMMEIYLREAQNEFSAFIHSTPEERYKIILKTRPNLVNRVPQHQLASYLGMTPESLSRIKKRLNNNV